MNKTNIMELGHAARALVNDCMFLREGEELLITADTNTDWAVVQATAAAGLEAGARMCTALSAPSLMGRLGDSKIPETIKAAMGKCDVWIDCDWPYLGTSTAYEKVMASGRIRYMLLGNVDAAGFNRLYGKSKLKETFALQRKAAELIRKSRKGRITTERGTDFTFENDPDRPVNVRGLSEKPGYNSPLGLVSWAPIESSVRGTMKLEGVANPSHYSGILTEPVTLEIDGSIRDAKNGGREGRDFSEFLRSVSDGTYGGIAHLGLGLHTTAAVTGACFNEDIRVVGNGPIGFGYQFSDFKGAKPATRGGSAHPDALLTKLSLWLDGSLIVDKGEIVAPLELVQLVNNAMV
jgi:2,5-dihydroxypyridine 5,6-dioxygenase